MRRFMGLFLCLAIMAIAHKALAISFIVTGAVAAPASPVAASSGACAPVSTVLMFPVPPGTRVCQISIAPSNWVGKIIVDDTVHFQISQTSTGPWLTTAGTSPPEGPFSVTLTTAP
jgi:hypothetical protein